MRQKTIATAALLGAALGGALLGQAALRPWAAQAQTGTGSGATAALAGLLNGRLYPTTLKSEQIDTSYRMVRLVDAQSKADVFATKGETVSLAGETFLVAYVVPLTTPVTGPARPKPETTAELTLINLRALEAIGSIQPVTPPDAASDAAPADAGAAKDPTK